MLLLTLHHPRKDLRQHPRPRFQSSPAKGPFSLKLKNSPKNRLQAAPSCLKHGKHRQITKLEHHRMLYLVLAIALAVCQKIINQSEGSAVQ